MHPVHLYQFSSFFCPSTLEPSVISVTEIASIRFGKSIRELAGQEFADMLDLHTLCNGFFGDPHPDQVTLGNVPRTFAVIDKVVDPPFQHRS